MRVIEHDDVNAFRDRAMPLLMRDECANCVMIGVIGRLVEGKPATKSGEIVTPLLLTVEEGDDVLAVATQTPPHALLFSALDEACAEVIANHLHARKWDGTQFSGILPTLFPFTTLFRSIGRASCRERVYDFAASACE